MLRQARPIRSAPRITMHNLDISLDVGADQPPSEGRPSTAEVQQSLADALAAGATIAEIEDRIHRGALGLGIEGARKTESSP